MREKRHQVDVRKEHHPPSTKGTPNTQTPGPFSVLGNLKLANLNFNWSSLENDLNMTIPFEGFTVSPPNIQNYSTTVCFLIMSLKIDCFLAILGESIF